MEAVTSLLTEAMPPQNVKKNNHIKRKLLLAIYDIIGIAKL